MYKVIEQKWDLESLYQVEFAEVLAGLEAEVRNKRTELQNMPAPHTDQELAAFKQTLEDIGRLDAKVNQAQSYAMCRMSEDTADRERAAMQRRSSGLMGMLKTLYIEDEMMIDVQRGVYQDALAGYTPGHWISNNLFYLSERPFYNYQYMLGYLFSAGLYALGMEKGEMTAAQYADFLQDTGCMNMEELARKHLGVDLTDERFWLQSLDVLVRDVEDYVKLG